MRRRLRNTLVVVGAGVLSACGTRTVLKPNPRPRTSYEMLVPKGVPHYTLEPGESAVQPLPRRQVAPVYPPPLVRPGAAPVTVVVQLVIDEHGNVEGVYPVSNTDKRPSQALFERAVEHAAMHWTFTPLWMEKPSSDGTYTLTAKPFSLWYVFHFKIVNGKPIVETVKH